MYQSSTAVRCQARQCLRTLSGLPSAKPARASSLTRAIVAFATSIRSCALLHYL